MQIKIPHLPFGKGFAAGCCLGFTALSIPFIIMFHIYRNNYDLICFQPVLIIAVIIAVIAGTAMGTGVILFKSIWLSFLLALQSTAMLFLYKPYCKLMYQFMPHGITVSYVVLWTITGIVLCKRLCGSLYLPPLRRILPVAAGLLVCLGMELRYVIPLASQDPQYFPTGNYSVKTEADLPKPDIYWIHCDGMLGFETFRKYYHDEQRDWKKYLHENDFILNEHAEFEACHQTQIAVPVLMCPHLYDHHLSGYLSTAEKAADFGGKQHIYGGSLTLYRLQDNELYTAFEKRGYGIHMIPDIPNYFLYYFREKSLNVAEISSALQLKNFAGEIFDRLSIIVSLLVNDRLDRIMRGNRKEDSVGAGQTQFHPMALNYNLFYGLSALKKEPSPKLVVINQDRTHNPYLLDENGVCHQGKNYLSETDPLAYAPQHRYGVKIVRNLVDRIIRNDPDAVIVIQGDHGLHGSSPEEFRFRFGKDCRITELWNSVVSAVRIPPKFRQGDENVLQETPLNISRYLINHYVGRGNCSYIKVSHHKSGGDHVH